MTVPQIFIGDDPCRRQRRSVCARGRRQARRAARRRRAAGMSDAPSFDLQGRDDPDALRAGARRQSRRRRAHDRRGENRRRRLRADAGDDQHHGGQARAAVRHASWRKKPTPRSPRSASWRASSAIYHSRRFAGDQAHRRQGRQPLVPDRADGRDRRALRQDPHVRRRSRQRRELSRVAQLPARRAGGAVPICRGAGSA